MYAVVLLVGYRVSDYRSYRGVSLSVRVLQVIM